MRQLSCTGGCHSGGGEKGLKKSKDNKGKKKKERVVCQGQRKDMARSWHRHVLS